MELEPFIFRREGALVSMRRGPDDGGLASDVNRFALRPLTADEFAVRYKHVVDESMVKLPPSLALSQVVQVVDEPIESHRCDTSELLPM